MRQHVICFLVLGLAAGTSVAQIPTTPATLPRTGEAIGTGSTKELATADGIRRAIADKADPLLAARLAPWVAQEKITAPAEPVREAMAMLIRRTLCADAQRFAASHEIRRERFEENEWVARRRARGEEVPDLPGVWEVAVRATVDEAAMMEAKDQLAELLLKTGRPVVRLQITEMIEGELRETSRVQTRLGEQLIRAGFDTQLLPAPADATGELPCLGEQAGAEALAASLAASMDRPSYVLVGDSEAATASGGKTDTVLYLFQIIPKTKPVLMARLSPAVKVLQGTEEVKLNDLAIRSHARQVERPVMQHLLSSWPEFLTQAPEPTTQAGP